MSFNVGLSALNAAQQEINITGNNIANSSTNGFKSSRATFGDVYAASVLGGGSRQQGGGVTLQAINQSFTQGNISFTNNTLDMAINGGGFFIQRSESGVSYSRAGAFGTDKNGTIVNSAGERLQGFAASASGIAAGGGPLTDLVVTTGEIPPRPTTLVSSVINLDASALPSSIIGSTLVANQGRSGTPIQLDLTDPRQNGYEANAISVVGSDNVTRLISVPANSTANQVAQLFSAVNGVTARGTSVAYISGLTAPATETTRFAINGREFEVDPTDLDALEQVMAAINGITSNLSARMVGGNLEITHNLGSDLVITPGSSGNGEITMLPSLRNSSGAAIAGAGPVTADVGAGEVIVIGGTVDFTLDEGVVMTASSVDAAGDPIDQSTRINSIFGDISGTDALAGVPFETNTFDPKNPDTYFRSSAVTVFDTLGNQHTLTQFFVKERPENAGDTANTWSVYLQVDGRNIGYDPNSLDGQPVLARFPIVFTDGGLYDQNQTPIEITNWNPVDAQGRRVGAGPVPGNPNVGENTNNSNFRIDLSSMTQFGGDFSVQSNNQDGFAKGQLTGLEINGRGLISARFSNGQSRAIGEVALANFANPGGLSNMGGTRFAETSESGAASVSGAGTAGLGAIQSGALEDSNVDLPAELVQLIISQRNYQAAAQIISATDAATQTIINL
ncbi:MAG: flagellar hook-basal body complex protein [Gammaproteobacteria bacterium]|nr:flagellar hook-basal body complex protein [Gammaproteobacteria bacterium]